MLIVVMMHIMSKHILAQNNNSVIKMNDYTLTVSDFMLTVSDHMLTVSDYKLTVNDYKLTVSDYKLMMMCKSHIMYHELLKIVYKLSLRKML